MIADIRTVIYLIGQISIPTNTSQVSNFLVPHWPLKSICSPSKSNRLSISTAWPLPSYQQQTQYSYSLTTSCSSATDTVFVQPEHFLFINNRHSIRTAWPLPVQQQQTLYLYSLTTSRLISNTALVQPGWPLPLSSKEWGFCHERERQQLLQVHSICIQRQLLQVLLLVLDAVPILETHRRLRREVWLSGKTSAQIMEVVLKRWSSHLLTNFKSLTVWCWRNYEQTSGAFDNSSGHRWQGLKSGSWQQTSHRKTKQMPI